MPNCAELNFTNEGGVRGSTRLLKNIGGLMDLSADSQVDATTGRGGLVGRDGATAEQATPAFELLIDPDDPAFVAPRGHGRRDRRVCTRTGQREPQSDGVFYRAALEGLALRYRVCLGMLESLVEHRHRGDPHRRRRLSQNELSMPDDGRRLRSHGDCGAG